MGLIVSFGDYGVGDIVEKAEDLYDLLLDLCEDKLDWENILNRPDLYTTAEVYNKEEIDDMLEGIAPGEHTHEISDINGLQDELDVRYTKEEVDDLLGDKSDVGHTHPVEDIEGLTEAIQALGIQVVSELPTPVEDGKVYILHTSGAERFSVYISAGGSYIPLDAVTYTALATALATKQNKLTGNANQLTLGDGTFIARNKSAVGLGSVDNTSDLDKPISNATQLALDQKADISNVLIKDGDQTKTSGVLTFAVSPVVPYASESQEAINLGQVQSIVGDAFAEASHPEIVEFDSPSEQWIWNHEKNFIPAFDIVVGGVKVNAREEYPDNDTVIITFTKPQTGYLIVR